MQRKPAQFGFGRQRRLTRRTDFQRLLVRGTRHVQSGYVLYVSRRERGAPRLGIVISRKHSAKATVRNQIKRSVREAFRLEQAQLGALDMLVRTPYGARPGAAMVARLREMFLALTR